MSVFRVQGNDKVGEALLLIAGEYRTAPATRTMLLVIAATVLPLVVLIVVRLLGKMFPSIVGMSVGGLLVMAAFGVLADFLFGALRVGPDGIERRSPWFWLNWHVARDDISALGVVQGAHGRQLEVETIAGRRYFLPFRSGFERLLEQRA